MPVAIMLMGLVFNTLNAYLIAGWLYDEAPAGMYGTSWLWSPQFIIGTAIFFLGMGINMLELSPRRIKVANMLPAIFLPLAYLPLAEILTQIFHTIGS